jgi:hypothetical protein
MLLRMRSAVRDFGFAVLGTLAPCLAFLAGLAIADVWVDHKDFGLRDDANVGNMAFYFGLFFIVPTFFPIWLTSTIRSRILVIGLLSATALWAGIQAMAVDDAQAGFAVFAVPMAAIVISLAILGAGAIRSFTGHRDAG